MSALTERLDKIASSLENKGMLIEAEEVDTISNTIEAFEKEAWTAMKSPIYLKFLEPAMNAAKADNADAALKYLNMGDGMRKALVEGRMNTPEFKFFSGLWLQAAKSLENGDTAKASEDLDKAFGFLQKIEPMINAEAPGYGRPLNQQTQRRQQGQPTPQILRPGQGYQPMDLVFRSKKEE